MADNEPKGPTGGTIGLMLGGVARPRRRWSSSPGGHLGGVKEIRSDADLPPIASPEKKNLAPITP